MALKKHSRALNVEFYSQEKLRICQRYYNLQIVEFMEHVKIKFKQMLECTWVLLNI